MTSLPNFLVSLGLAVVNMSIKNKTSMDLSKLKPIKFVDQIMVPAFFITGEHDQIVPKENTLNLYNNYGG